MKIIFNSNENLRTSLKHVALDIYVSNSMLPKITFLPTNIDYFEVSIINIEPFLNLTSPLTLCCKTIQFKYLVGNRSSEVRLRLLPKVLDNCMKVTIRKTNYYFRFKRMEVFLSCLPEIKQLSIDNTCGSEFITAEQLEFLLRNHGSKLLKFQYAFRNDYFYTFADFCNAWEQS